MYKDTTLKTSIPLVKTIYVIVLMFACWGFFENNISLRLGGVAYFFVSVIIMIMAFYPWRIQIPVENRNLISSICLFFIFAVLYALLSAALLRTAHNTVLLGFTIPVYTYNIILNMPIWIGCAVVVLRNNVNDYKWMLNLLYWILVFNIVVTLVTLFIDPNYARNSSAGIIDSSMSAYRLWGAMGYELSYSLSMLVPLFFLLGRRGQKKWYILAILSAYLVVKSSFFIGVVALLLNIVLSMTFGIKRKTIRNVMTFLFVLACTYLVFNQSIIGVLLINISNQLEVGDLQRRFYQIGMMLAYNNNTGDSLIRFQLYEKSLKGIGKSPFLGQLLFNRDFEISDHSTFLDTWSGFGIIPTALIVYSMIKAYVFSKKKTERTSSSNTVLASYITFFFIGTFNQLFVAPLIMLVPIMFVPMISTFVGEIERDRLR